MSKIKCEDRYIQNVSLDILNRKKCAIGDIKSQDLLQCWQNALSLECWTLC
jgi:hypothetical protein